MTTVDKPTYPRNGTSSRTPAHPENGTAVEAIELTDLSEELKRLSEVNQELLGTLGGEEPQGAAESEDMTLLRLENEELRARGEALGQLLGKGGTTGGGGGGRQGGGG